VTDFEAPAHRRLRPRLALSASCKSSRSPTAATHYSLVCHAIHENVAQRKLPAYQLTSTRPHILMHLVHAEYAALRTALRRT
jgi:hypothetical protein